MSGTTHRQRLSLIVQPVSTILLIYAGWIPKDVGVDAEGD